MKSTYTPVALLLLAASAAMGIINPNFTPRHLVDEAAFAFAGPLAAGSDAMHWKMANASQLKGRSPAAHQLDLTGCNRDHLAAVQGALRDSGKAPAVLFASRREGGRTAYLHAANRWVALKRAAQGSWHVTGSAANMSGTYAGATDKLILMARHLIADDDADVPIGAGVRWIDSADLGSIGGECGGLAAVDRAAAGKVHLFVASTAGDRLFRQKGDDDALEDITAAVKLRARSRRFAWMDVNLDGRADLLSWDGRTVSVHLGAATGELAPGAGWTIDVQGECLALGPCAVGGKAAVVISTPAAAKLLVAGGRGFKSLDLPAAGQHGGQLGRASACIVADLDGDGYGDILQPRQAGGLLWKGKADGFAAPTVCPVKTGRGTATPAVADFDGDGSLDVLLAGSAQNSLWENDGKAGFREVMGISGSVSYKCPAGARDAAAMDLNHDGRPDLCLAYARGDLLYHWNRGYRAMAEEGEVRLTAARAAPGEPAPGQQAVAAGDFNNDGSQDLAVLLTDGRLQCYFNEHMDMPGARLRLPKGAAGCVTASGWMGEAPGFCVGAVVVRGHAPSIYLPARYAGELEIRWRTPAGPRKRTVEVEEGTVEAVLTDKAK